MSEQTPNQDSRSPEEIQADIARTRLELTSTVDELVDRLDPRNQIAEAKATVRAKLQAFTEDVKNREPKAMSRLGIAAAGVVTVVLVVVLARRNNHD